MNSRRTEWKTAVAAVTLAALWIPAAALAQHDGKAAPSLAGTWKFSLHGDHVIPAGLELKQDGTALTGTMMLMGKDINLAGDITDGVVTLNGNARLFSHGDEQSKDAPKLKIVGKIQEDGSLAGKMPGPRGDIEWTAERFKERKARPTGEKKSDAAGVGGSWSLTSEGDRAIQVAMALKQDGSKVTGTIVMHGSDVPVQGEFVDGKLAVSGTAPMQGGQGMEIKLTASMTAEGTLAGEFKGGNNSMKWTAERLKKQHQ